jgi:hypothetical protein
VLFKHTTETGENRKLTYYSLYMHLLDLDGITRLLFLAQVFKETDALRATVEKGDPPYFRTMYEVLTPEEAAHDFDHKHAWLHKMNFLKGRDRPTYVAQRPGEIRQKAEKLGNTHAGDGPRFCGRGLIHLTGRDSYAKYGHYRKPISRPNRIRNCYPPMPWRWLTRRVTSG